MPSTLVRWCSSTTDQSVLVHLDPGAARSRVSALGTRPVATSRCSAAKKYSMPSSSVVPTSTGRPRLSTAVSCCPSRRTTRRLIRSVNRSATTSSACRSSRSPRWSSVTSVPKAAKTWANSAATQPPPTMISDLGSARQPHDRVGGVDAGGQCGIVEPGDVRDPGTRAGGDHERVGGDLLLADGQQLGTDEPCVARGTGSRSLLRAVVLTAGRDRVDPAEDPVADLGPAGRSPRPRAIAERRGVPGGLGEVGRVDEHLGRDAADVQAGAAEPLRAVDQRHLPVVETARRCIELPVPEPITHRSKCRMAPIVPCAGRSARRRRRRAASDAGVGVQAGDQQVDADEVEPEGGQPDHRQTTAARAPFQPAVTRACR